MVAKSFQVDDLVWAKMKGYSPWPGKIIEPPADAKSKPKKFQHYVFFFGSDNHAWIPDERIFLHNDKMVEKYGNKKTGLYQTAVETIIKLSKGKSKYSKTNDSSETADLENISKISEQENSFDKSANSSKKTETNSSTPKNLKKKFTIKKMSTIKKSSVTKKAARKRAYSPDRSELLSFGLSDLFSSRSVEPYSPKSFRIDENYAQLISNIPPNLSYGSDGIGSLTPAVGVLQRKYHDRPDTPPIDLTYQSEVLKNKKIQPISKKIGFLGLGKLSQGIVKNLHHSGHKIIIWNQTPMETKDFSEKFNLQVAETPSDLIEVADIAFSCVSDAETAKQIFFGNCGIIKELEHRNGERKGYIEMTPMDPKVSEHIASEIRQKGGRYLEAPFSGSRIDANEGTLMVLCAGDKSLYDECRSCFDAISKKHMFITDVVGTAYKLNLFHNMFMGTTYACLAETLALVKRIGVEPEVFFELFRNGIVSSESIIEKGKAMANSQYVCNNSIKQMQLDLNLGLSLAEKFVQPTPIFAAANEVYKHCKSMRYGDHDISAVFEGTKP